MREATLREGAMLFLSVHLYSLHLLQGMRPIAEPHTCSLVQQAKVRLELKTRLRSCGKLDALPTTNDTALKNFISCEAVFFLRKQVCWAVALSDWVTAPGSSEGTYRPNLQGC
jgi:hypothetical protein